MSDTNIEKPDLEEIVIFLHHTEKDGQPVEAWLPLLEAMGSVGLSPENAVVTITGASLSVRPAEQKGGTTSLGYGPGFWAKKADLGTPV